MYDVGEKPGRGTYTCFNCRDWSVTLDDDDDHLPPCANCSDEQEQNVKYVRVAEKL